MAKRLEDYLGATEDPQGDVGSVEVLVSERLRRAFEVAERHGRIIGRVARYATVRLDDNLTVKVEVDPEVYFSGSPSAIGSYVVLVDVKDSRLVLGVVTAVERKDELAALGIEPPLSGYGEEPDPAALLTGATLEVRLVSELGSDGEVRPAYSSVEPQSPVVDPKPDVVARLLDLPGEEGVTLGSLATPAGLVKGGEVPVKLPYKALLQHVLVVGTTGSGKTTLLKNMIADLLSRGTGDFIPVVLDLNQDFVQLPLPPRDHEVLYDPVARSVYSDVKPPSSAIVVSPLPRGVVEDANSGYQSEVYRYAAREYGSDVIEPLLGREPGWSCSRNNSSGWWICFEREGQFVYIPYSIRTDDPNSSATDALQGLLPGLTAHANDLLRRLREGYYRLKASRRRGKGYYPLLQSILAALSAYISELKNREELSPEALESLVGDEVIPFIAGAPHDDPKRVVNAPHEHWRVSILNQVADLLEILRRSRPHRGTVEALYRRVLGLLETGIVDVLVYDEKSGLLWSLQEPHWGWIAGLASERRAPIIVDLRWAADRGRGGLDAPRLAAYRMLERVIAWKHGEYRGRIRGGARILVFIDEAHQFFPQEGGGEEREAVRQVAGMISRLARLGRARGVGLVFSTHSPRDLHDIIIQLANAKIVLRTELQHGERLGVPGELRQAVAFFPDRYMLVMSHVYRGGSVMAKTSKPLVMHHDVSALT